MWLLIRIFGRDRTGTTYSAVDAWEADAYLWCIFQLQTVRTDIQRSISAIERKRWGRGDRSYGNCKRLLNVKKVMRTLALMFRGATRPSLDQELVSVIDALTYSREALECRSPDAAITDLKLALSTISSVLEKIEKESPVRYRAWRARLLGRHAPILTVRPRPSQPLQTEAYPQDSESVPNTE